MTRHWSSCSGPERIRVPHRGSPIRRIDGRWLRNLAIALGNARTSPDIITALNARIDDSSPLVREHVAWALAQHQGEV